jgi:hypothetical protein
MEDTPMEQHYREHVIGYDTAYDHKSKQWMGAAQVRFSEGVKVRIVSVPVPATHFETKEEAEQGCIAAARNWIDSRIQSSSSSSNAIGPFSRKKKTAKSVAA